MAQLRLISLTKRRFVCKIKDIVKPYAFTSFAEGCKANALSSNGEPRLFADRWTLRPSTRWKGAVRCGRADGAHRRGGADASVEKHCLDLEFKSVKKKYKALNFAAGCSREVIQRGADMLGWTLDDLISDTILAMRTLEKPQAE